MNKQQLIFGQKTDEYPYGYGYCQCGCKAKTYEFLPDSYKKYMPFHRHTKPNKWLPDLSEIQSKAEARRKEQEELDLNKWLENRTKHEAPDKIKHIFEYYGIEPKDTPEASQVLNDGSSFIYVIRCESFVKIGIAENVEYRLSIMQVGNPFELSLLKKFPSHEPKRDEAWLHNKYIRYHVRGEWFQLPPDILANLLDMKDLEEMD